MKDSVTEAIEELKGSFGDENVIFTPENDGGAYVIINNIDIGEKFVPPIIWCSFYIKFLYPSCDIYPHYVNPELTLSNGNKLNGPFSPTVNKNKVRCIQVSRRSKRWNPAQDTALLKLEKVLNFIKDI